jgi:uncharacterized protein YwqG
MNKLFASFKKNKASSELAEILATLKRNEIEISLSNGAAEPDASKIGGKPFLPKDFAWPHFEGESYEDGWGNRPLSFICQINIAEAKKFDEENLLPEKGMLYFFYESASQPWGFDPKDAGSARVFYYEDTAGFETIDFPEDLGEEFRLKERAIEFSAKASYPSFEEFDVYSDFDCDWEEYDETLKSLGVDTEETEKCKLLGYADIVQGEMLTECERTSRGLYCGDHESYVNTPAEVQEDIQAHAKDWVLLCQVCSFYSDDFELMFGDCGLIYFYIKKEDLKKKNFDKVWLLLQCG